MNPDADDESTSSTAVSDDSWKQYWDFGFLTSCHEAFAGKYAGAIRVAWDQFFADLPHGSRILDICTGNGAIAALANDYSRAHDRGFEIHGIDQAAIRPMDTVKEERARLDGIVFHPSTPLEATGLPDSHFGAVTGQYAYEYTDETRSADELARITCPGAPLQLLIHHSDSVVMHTSRAELAHCRLIFETTRIFELAREMIEMVGACSPAERAALARDPEAERLRESLNTAAARLTAAAETSEHPELLRVALKRVAGAYRRLQEGQQAALSDLAAGRGLVESNRDRLRDLMAAGRSGEGIVQTAGQLDAAGFAMEPAIEFHDDRQRLVAWLLQARRRPS